MSRLTRYQHYRLLFGPPSCVFVGYATLFGQIFDELPPNGYLWIGAFSCGRKEEAYLPRSHVPGPPRHLQGLPEASHADLR